MKVYDRQLTSTDNLQEDSLHKLLKHIEAGSQVLDIGCGTGMLGGILVSEKNCQVTGVDINPDSIALAAEKLSHAICSDISQTPLSQTLSEQFDVIILADVLEHITNPDKLLQDCQKLLKPNGRLLISIPNAAYIGAILSLYYDEWNYGEEGILDTTHVRFYTRNSILNLLTDSGYQAKIIDYVAKDLTETEFTQRADCLKPAVFKWLTDKADAVAYQFIISATLNDSKQQNIIHTTPPPIHFQHIVKLYWQSTKDADFNEGYYQLQRGVMGKTNTLAFSLNINELVKFRLDFADRKSTYCIDKIEIYDADNRLHNVDDNDTISPFACVPNNNTFPMRLLADANANANVILDKPLSGENLSIIVTLQAPIDENNLSFPDTLIDPKSSDAYQALEQQNIALANEVKTLKNRMTALNHQIEQTQSSYDMLFDQLSSLKNSTTWKLTAPLRKLINLTKQKH